MSIFLGKHFAKLQSNFELKDTHQGLVEQRHNAVRTYLEVSLLYGDHTMEAREKATHQVLLSNTVYNVTRLALVLSTSDPSEWGILHQAKIGL